MRCSTVTVLVADEQPVVRHGLQSLLGSSSGIAVVAEAATARETVRQAVLHKPDVLVLDIELPGFRVDSTIREILRCSPSTSIVVFTSVDGEDAVVASIRAGARGYVLKTDPDEGLVRAIRAIATGEMALGRGAAERLVSRLASDAGDRSVFPTLTAREREVFELIESGLSNQAIAARLQLAPKTVGNHISAIFAKLHVRSRFEAIELARQSRLGRGRTDRLVFELVGHPRAGEASGEPAASAPRTAGDAPLPAVLGSRSLAP